MSRRAADTVISEGRVLVDSAPPSPGHQVQSTDIVTLDGQIITVSTKTTTIMLNKPPKYVCSRDGQGSMTIYELLPESLHHLKPVGRLDKYSSGLLLLTDDGELAHKLTHPSFRKKKTYEIKIYPSLKPEHAEAIDEGVELEDGLSRLELTQLDQKGILWKVGMYEGRNRQIRRTFGALEYNVLKLHRTHFGDHVLNDLKMGSWKYIEQ